MLTVSKPIPAAFVQPFPAKFDCNEKLVADAGHVNSRVVPDELRVNVGRDCPARGSSESAPEVKLESVSLRNEIWP